MVQTFHSKNVNLVVALQENHILWQPIQQFSVEQIGDRLAAMLLVYQQNNMQFKKSIFVHSTKDCHLL